MSERVTLTVEQFAEIQRAARDREAAIIRDVLQVPDYPPLPACPECGEHPKRISSAVEDPGFETYESAVLVNFAPCGHRFRALAESGRTAAPSPCCWWRGGGVSGYFPGTVQSTGSPIPSGE